jgi:hypothetical protein
MDPAAAVPTAIAQRFFAPEAEPRAAAEPVPAPDA